MSSYDAVVSALKFFAEKAKSQPLTFGEALDTLDHAAYAFICLILALPFLQPVPLGPLTVIGGLTFATMGWQLWRGHDSPVLPERVRSVAMSEKTWRILVKVCLNIVGFCHKFTKPRYSFMISGPTGSKLGAIILIIAGLLMAIPFGVLPFNNMLPALSIIFYCFGELEQDGLMVMIAFIWLGITIVYFSLFFFGLWYFGSEAIIRWLA